MPSIRPSEPVAHPAPRKAARPETSPAVAEKSAPGAAKAPVKRVAKTLPLPLPTPMTKPAVKAVKAALAATDKPASSKLLKPKKIKLVHESFTIPKLEYLMIDALKLRAGSLGHSVKKSELVRAGIKALAAMPDSQFMTAVKALAPIKTRRQSEDG